MKTRILLEPGAGGGGGGESWTATLPEDIRNEPMFKNIPDVPTLAKNYIHAQRLVGADKVQIPQKTWGESHWEEFYSKTGRPTTPEGYQVPDIKLEQGLAIDDGRLKEIRTTFHKLGLNEQQGRGVLEYYFNMLNGTAKSSREAMEAERLSTENALKQEYGDRYATTLETAKAVIREYGDEQFIKFLDESKLGNHPTMIKMLAKIGTNLLEDKQGGRGGGLRLNDAAGAQREIDQLKLDKEFQNALNNRELPGHQEAVDRWLKLHQLVHPGQQRD